MALVARPCITDVCRYMEVVDYIKNKEQKKFKKKQIVDAAASAVPILVFWISICVLFWNYGSITSPPPPPSGNEFSQVLLRIEIAVNLLACHGTYFFFFYWSVASSSVAERIFDGQAVGEGLDESETGDVE